VPLHYKIAAKNDHQLFQSLHCLKIQAVPIVVFQTSAFGMVIFRQQAAQKQTAK